MVITNRGIIIRQTIDAISPQSRMATGVRVQRLDDEDAIAAVAIVPPVDDEEASLEEVEAAAEAAAEAEGERAPTESGLTEEE